MRTDCSRFGNNHSQPNIKSKHTVKTLRLGKMSPLAVLVQTVFLGKWLMNWNRMFHVSILIRHLNSYRMVIYAPKMAISVDTFSNVIIDHSQKRCAQWACLANCPDQLHGWNEMTQRHVSGEPRYSFFGRKGWVTNASVKLSKHFWFVWKTPKVTHWDWIHDQPHISASQ